MTPIQQVEIQAPNGLIFISDVAGGEPPEPVWGAKILSTPSCISVACEIDCEGPTTITLGPSNQVSRSNSPIFDGILETPSRTIVLQLVDCTEVARAVAGRTKSRVRIWTNRSVEPDEVVVGID